VVADWVVMAIGVTPRRSLAETCGERFEQFRVIGDASKPGRILEAMQDAQGKAFVFDTTKN
jgi:NAD(P)H-nitrite reductase large subunit